MNTSFRQQTVVRAFAFGCTLALAACATDGSVKASAQSQLGSACDKATSAITLAKFFEAKMTPAEQKILAAADSTETNFCSPSALASDLTPAAYSANMDVLGKVLADMNSLTDAHAQ